MKTTLIIAPDASSSAALRFAYRNSAEIKVAALMSIIGHRGDRIVVLPFPDTGSDLERETYERVINEQVRSKVGPGVELVLL